MRAEAVRNPLQPSSRFGKERDHLDFEVARDVFQARGHDSFERRLTGEGLRKVQQEAHAARPHAQHPLVQPEPRHEEGQRGRHQEIEEEHQHVFQLRDEEREPGRQEEVVPEKGAHPRGDQDREPVGEEGEGDHRHEVEDGGGAVSDEGEREKIHAGHRGDHEDHLGDRGAFRPQVGGEPHPGPDERRAFLLDHGDVDVAAHLHDPFGDRPPAEERRPADHAGFPHDDLRDRVAPGISDDREGHVVRREGHHRRTELPGEVHVLSERLLGRFPQRSSRCPRRAPSIPP